MRTAHRRDSIPANIRRAARAIERFKPFPEITIHLTPLEEEQEKFKTRYDTWVAARSAERIAIGDLHVAEAVLENERRGLGFALLTLDFGRRNSEQYRTYFPGGFGATMRMAPRNSLALTAGLIRSLGEETNPTIAAHREALQAAYDGLTAALARRQEAADLVGQTKALLVEEFSEWRKVFNTFYFSLRTNFPERRPWFEALLASRRSAAGEEEPEETDGFGEAEDLGEAEGSEETEESGAMTGGMTSLPVPFAPVPSGGNASSGPEAEEAAA
jgi:hypothetical protein